MTWVGHVDPFILAMMPSYTPCPADRRYGRDRRIVRRGIRSSVIVPLTWSVRETGKAATSIMPVLIRGRARAPWSGARCLERTHRVHMPK